jgi:hypothetical protein
MVGISRVASPIPPGRINNTLLGTFKILSFGWTGAQIETANRPRVLSKYLRIVCFFNIFLRL